MRRTRCPCQRQWLALPRAWAGGAQSRSHGVRCRAPPAAHPPPPLRACGAPGRWWGAWQPAWPSCCKARTSPHSPPTATKGTSASSSTPAKRCSPARSGMTRPTCHTQVRVQRGRRAGGRAGMQAGRCPPPGTCAALHPPAWRLAVSPQRAARRGVAPAPTAGRGAAGARAPSPGHPCLQARRAAARRSARRSCGARIPRTCCGRRWP
jgi:hypothetical protein